jgi:hypothetical protein
MKDFNRNLRWSFSKNFTVLSLDREKTRSGSTKILYGSGFGSLNDNITLIRNNGLQRQAKTQDLVGNSP